MHISFLLDLGRQTKYCRDRDHLTKFKMSLRTKLTRFKNAKGIFISYPVPAASIGTIFGDINDTIYILHAQPILSCQM